MGGALQPTTWLRGLLVLICDELLVAAGGLFGLGRAWSRLWRLFCGFRHWGRTLVGKLRVDHQSLKRGVGVHVLRAKPTLLDRFSLGRAAARLLVLARRQGLYHLLLNVLGLLGLLFLGGLRRQMLIDVLHHMRVFDEVLLLRVLLAVLVRLLLGCLRLLLEQQDLLDLLRGQI